MTAVGILGTKGHVDNVYSKTTTQAMNAVGNNTGNLVFQHAVYHQIAEEKYVIGQDLAWDMGLIRERCRVIVVPSANHIRENFDMTSFVDLIDKVQLPLVFLGLGAQATDYDQAEITLHPSISRLVALAKERSKLVSIRGEYTAKTLEKLGVYNYRITGCPSNFINLDQGLPDKIDAKMKRPIKSFITHGDEPWPKTKEKQIVEKLLATWTMEGAAMQSQQSVPSFMEYIRDNNPYGEAAVPEPREEALRRALMPSATLDQFRDFLAAKLRVYFSVSQWMEDSSKYDFSLGLRLHGNMVAWQAAVPSLWLYHDSRTRELAEVMKLPHMNYLDFIEHCPTVQSAWERVEFDKEGYRQRRIELARNFVEVYEAQGIKTTISAFLKQAGAAAPQVA